MAEAFWALPGSLVALGTGRSPIRVRAPFEMTSQPMKGSVVVERAGIETEPELDGWGREGIAVARRLPPER